jgi:hypothetical protein
MDFLHLIIQKWSIDCHLVSGFNMVIKTNMCLLNRTPYTLCLYDKRGLKSL